MGSLPDIELSRSYASAGRRQAARASKTVPLTSPLTRLRIWYSLLVIMTSVVIIRLFYLQVIRHDYYRKAASTSQLKEYEIPASRGAIDAHDGTNIVPLVLNEPRYTLYADPAHVSDPERSAAAVQKIIGGNQTDYEQKLRTPRLRYVVLAKKLNQDQQRKIDQAAQAEAKQLKGVKKATYNWRGIGTRETEQRTYPQGSLAAQLLGFVNDDGQGKYGIEQALDQNLRGTPGRLRAITDAQGVPLVANKDNVMKAPASGQRQVLTIDLSMQKQLEDILKSGVEKSKGKSGSALILDPYSGKIKALANYPTYNPAEFYKVEDGNLFSNAAVGAAFEVGSTMKPLTAAAALDQGVVNRNTSYFDPSRFQIDGYTVKNIEEDGGPGQRTLADILQLSLNTGATWLLMQMGGGQINQKARLTWHDYLTNHYQFGHRTGVEQGYEASGTIPDPMNGYGLNLQYANTAFGQGMTATPLQMAAAYSSVLNGGTYYRPQLVDGTLTPSGKFQAKVPQVVRSGVVKPEVSQTIRDFMEYTFGKNHAVYGMSQLRSQYLIGAKTGTAQIPNPSGGYYEDKFNGTFVGFVGGGRPEYVIVVSVIEPHVSGYAGSKASGPIFVALANMLIDNFNVAPKGS